MSRVFGVNTFATIVMVTHSDRDAAYAGRVIDLFDGTIVGQTIKKS